LAVASNVRVYSVGKEKGYGEARRGMVFYRLLFGLLLRHRYDAGFAHMMPLFAVMAAPLLKLWRIPITLWYTHKAVSAKLRLAEKWVDHIVTSSPEGFRLPSAKLRVIGHGIDTEVFVPAPLADSSSRPFSVITVGRIAPVKGLETLIETAQQLHNQGVDDIRMRIIGGAAPQDAAYSERLRQMVIDNDLQSVVTFAGPVSHDQVVSAYQIGDVLVNLSATGSQDKAVLEAMSCGLPVITSNEAFAALLAPWSDMLLVPPREPGKLAEQIRRLKAMPPDECRALGMRLRALVVEGHSLTRLAQRLESILRTGHEPD
jgi:glycosyltransferase involved in cell wall biosynthesis